MKYLKLSAAAVAAVAALGIGAATAAAATPSPGSVHPRGLTCGSTVEFRNGGAGRVWDIQGASMNNQTPIQMYDPNGGWNQQFQLCSSDTFPGYIISNPASGKCATVSNPSNANFSTLALDPCVGSVNQDFQFEDATVAGEEVVSIGSGKCVDIGNFNFNAGVVLQQFTCNGGLNQLFFMNAV